MNCGLCGRAQYVMMRNRHEKREEGGDSGGNYDSEENEEQGMGEQSVRGAIRRA